MGWPQGSGSPERASLTAGVILLGLLQQSRAVVSMRRILHVDMDAFFAAVELRRHPALRGKPVVVGGQGDPTRRGVVSTASYEARRFGIRSGMPLRTAYQRCPQAVFLPVDYPAYAEISKKVKTVLQGFSFVLEDVGIDEAFLDISDVPSPVGVARAIKRAIYRETGLTCSIGIAPNKLLAKIASDMEKPDGLTVIEESDIATRIWPLPTRRLRSVGPKTEERLRSLQVTTIGELARIPLERLVAHFGRSHGYLLHQAARGIDERALVTHWEPKSLSRETTFQEDIADGRVLRQVLARHTQDLAHRLRTRGYRARGIAVKVRYVDFTTHTRAVTLEQATDQAEQLMNAALQCLARFSLAKKVRLLGVRLSGLKEQGDC